MGELQSLRAWRAIVVPYVLSRFLTVATLVTTRHVFTTLHLAEPSALHGRSGGLLGWDASWYRDIASSGYSGVAKEGLRFFPLLPMLGRVVSWLPGVDAGLAVLIVVNVAALAAGFVVYELAVQERHDPDIARRAVWILFLVPPAYVLMMGYAEALFILFSAISLLALRRRWWLVAIAAGALAALARPVGALLAFPIAIEGWRARRYEM
ncbi:MAG TPA: mannosyltransferase family protein, partial [Acidimicrobiia bacterium]|nr:mannosyltransferase family protein [Acidimicrobiia bacterium]